jgi:HD-GYP domain-containing protein (c-di-GMP phosphodiesterase class II)
MTTTQNFSSTTSVSVVPSPQFDISTSVDAARESLTRWFDVDFSVFDGASGDVLYASRDQPSIDQSTLGGLCCAVAQRGEAGWISRQGPISVLAVPLNTNQQITLVAVATFLTEPTSWEQNVAEVSELLGFDSAEAARWINRQTPWTHTSLQKMVRLAIEKWDADQQKDRLDAEVEGLSKNLSSTYEEISLLHRLTQGLRISSKEEDLGQMTLEWLAEALPVSGLALQLTVPRDTESASYEGRTEPALISCGEQPLDLAQFNAMIADLELGPRSRPFVFNEQMAGRPDWVVDGLHQLIIVPLAEGDNLFGYLVAVNHIDGAEFGTPEASLMSSVSAILGIHSSNIDLYRQQAELFADVVRALSAAIDAKDPYTCGHSDRVAQVSVRLAKQLGLDPEQLNTIYLAGLLHDIGKIGIDDNVLRKPGKLTDAEYEHIKQHPRLGYQILADLKPLDKIFPVVLHHHESWNGKGYPAGLAGEDIPLLARIVAVADSFDAMSSDRPYRKGMDDEKLDGILHGGGGTQWDQRVVDAFFEAREDVRAIGQSKPEPANAGPQHWT